MLRKLTALAATLAFALTTLAPVSADARDRRHDGYWSSRDHHYYDRHRRHRDNDDDEVAAGVLGLVLGVTLGAALASQPRQAPPPRARCYDNYQRCAPPPQYYNQGYDQGGYYEDPRSAYEQDYGYAPERPYYEDQRPQRMCRERQWDRYANRYLMVDVPC
ncbi:hypothetical protein [Vitreimonas sp.]|uniref:hypothetical protein n=1 Tax=Vitreimonas sp. TaxID=3069702 RepID=UPI002EDAA076